MIVETHKCPECDAKNEVKIPENFDDKVEKFFDAAPATVLKSLAALGTGILLSSTGAGALVGGAFIAHSLATDGTVKCGKCGERFVVRTQ